MYLIGLACFYAGLWIWLGIGIAFTFTGLALLASATLNAWLKFKAEVD